MELQQTIINVRGQFLGLFLSDQQFNEHIKFRIGVSHKLAAVSHVRHTGIMESLRFFFRKVTKTEINYKIFSIYYLYLRILEVPVPYLESRSRLS